MFKRHFSLSTDCTVKRTRIVLLSICLLAFILNLWGIRRDLPYVHDYDEQPFVIPAYGMAVTGGWNPHWFGHPGSTMIYPLRMIFAAWIACVHKGKDFFLAAANSLEAAFEPNASEFFILGRLLSIAYLVAAVPVLFFLARKIFSQRVAFWGSLLWIVIPLIVAQAQITRSDSATLFFGYLVLYLLIKFAEKPSSKLRFWIAALIACAVSSHYKMAFLGPLWLWTEWHCYRKNQVAASPGGVHHLASLKNIFLQLVFAGLVCALVFFVLNPFLFTHFVELKKNLASELPQRHPGADGLKPWGNLLWYLWKAIPGNFGWIQTVLAVAGIVVVFRRGIFSQRLLVGFIVLYLAGIIWSPLHWERWLVVILPGLAFLAFHSFFDVIESLEQPLRRIALAAGLALILLPPAFLLVFQNIRNSSQSTRIEALGWVKENVPAGSRIAYEWYSAPLRKEPYQAVEIHALPAAGDLKSYQTGRFEYLIVSDNMYNRFFAQESRYPNEARFYRELDAKAKLEVSFVPSMTIGGPEIRIYRLKPKKFGKPF